MGEEALTTAWKAIVGLTLTLFLIDAGLSARTLRIVGWRPLLQGVLPWVFTSVASLGIIMRFVCGVCAVAYHHLIFHHH